MSSNGIANGVSGSRRGSRTKRFRDHDSVSYQDDRGHWGSRAEFLLACLGYSVGLGNFWRFPYYAYENGGAAFLIPYLLLLFLVGRPMYLMEVTAGQYSQLGPFHTYKRAAPLMAGLGYTMVLKAMIGGPSYMVIISYSLHYLFNSLASIGHEVPWAVCPKGEGADPNCYEVGKEVPCSHYANLTTPPSNCTHATQNSALQYWRNDVLGLDPEGMTTFGDMGGIQVGLLVCLFIGWVITCLCLMYGIKSAGKVVYFTATFPYVVMIILMIAGLQLEGAYQGLAFLFIPDWSKLLDIHVWRVAMEQVLYSLSVGGGGLITFGSYNEFNRRVHIDVMILSVLDLVASLFCSITIFSVLGAMAHDLKLADVSSVVASGPGLAFVAYPQAISRTLPVPHLWSFLFFFMVFTLGLDSMFGSMETILAAIFDEFPATRKHKPIVVSCLCIVLFSIGIPYCTHKGQYLFDLMDKFMVGVGGLFTGFLSVVALMWVYGVNNFTNDIIFMLNYTPSIVMKLVWAVVSPFTLLTLFIGSMIAWKWPLYAGEIPYPTWAYTLAAAIPLLICSPLVIMFILHILDKTSTGKWRAILKPSSLWGPGCPVARQRLNEVRRLAKEAEYQQQFGRKNGKNGVSNPAFDTTTF